MVRKPDTSHDIGLSHTKIWSPSLTTCMTYFQRKSFNEGNLVKKIFKSFVSAQTESDSFRLRLLVGDITAQVCNLYKFLLQIFRTLSMLSFLNEHCFPGALYTLHPHMTYFLKYLNRCHPITPNILCISICRSDRTLVLLKRPSSNFNPESDSQLHLAG